MPKAPPVKKEDIVARLKTFAEGCKTFGATDGLWLYEGGCWKGHSWESPAVQELNKRLSTRFSDICLFYGNIIDYWRVILGCFAAFLIVWDFPFLAAFSIVLSHVLDAIDGPVARAYGHCSVFGSGIDWFADVQAQIVAALWWSALDPSVIPWICIATTIELGVCVFDFAETATGRYPKLAPSQTNPLLKILEWATPSQSYSFLGWFIWIAYPIWVCAFCLDLSWPVRSAFSGFILFLLKWGLFIPSVLYIWNEAAHGAVVWASWAEPGRKKEGSADDEPAVCEPDGRFDYHGMLPKDERTVLEEVLHSVDDTPSWAERLLGKEVFWVNLMQRISETEVQKMEGVSPAHSMALERIADRLCKQHYPGVEKLRLDGYGFIVNPPDSTTQKWHIDYNEDTSSLMIPMTEVNPENMTQYVAVPPTDRAVVLDAVKKGKESYDAIDLPALLELVPSLTVCQALGVPYSIFKMGFGTIHRGVGNRTGKARVVFWVAVARNDAPIIREPNYIDFKKEA